MSTAFILPTLSAGRFAASVGPPVPAIGVLGRKLRQSLPPSLVDAFDGIGDQIDAEILTALLCAPSATDLGSVFERLFPTFRDYYISTVLILWGFLREDLRQFSAVTIAGLKESEQLIRKSGPRWIGRDASLNALSGLATVIRVARGVTGFVGQAEAFHAHETGARSLANCMIAYAMACSAVVAALTTLEGGRATDARLENIAALAHWSRSYAAQAYHFARTLGLLKTARSVAPIRQSAEEDAVLAGAGLDDYTEALAQEDLP